MFVPTFTPLQELPLVVEREIVGTELNNPPISNVEELTPSNAFTTNGVAAVPPAPACLAKMSAL